MLTRFGRRLREVATEQATKSHDYCGRKKQPAMLRRENSHGKELTVVVDIGTEALTQAERILSAYLWREGRVHFTRKLTIKDVDRDDLPMAAIGHST